MCRVTLEEQFIGGRFSSSSPPAAALAALVELEGEG
jgi:hypothetical protein